MTPTAVGPGRLPFFDDDDPTETGVPAARTAACLAAVAVAAGAAIGTVAVAARGHAVRVGVKAWPAWFGGATKWALTRRTWETDGVEGRRAAATATAWAGADPNPTVARTSATLVVTAAKPADRVAAHRPRL